MVRVINFTYYDKNIYYDIYYVLTKFFTDYFKRRRVYSRNIAGAIRARAVLHGYSCTCDWIRGFR